jgi:hypothetical protein
MGNGSAISETERPTTSSARHWKRVGISGDQAPHDLVSWVPNVERKNKGGIEQGARMEREGRNTELAPHGLLFRAFPRRIPSQLFVPMTRGHGERGRRDDLLCPCSSSGTRRPTTSCAGSWGTGRHHRRTRRPTTSCRGCRTLSGRTKAGLSKVPEWSEKGGTLNSRHTGSFFVLFPAASHPNFSSP